MRSFTNAVAAEERAVNHQWYAIQSRVTREHQTSAALQALLNVEVYLPELPAQERARPATALFPGYLFAYINLSHCGISSLHTVPGVIRLVASGDTPQSIPAGTIAALRERVKQITATTSPEPHFVPGDPVRLRRGALQGLEAVFHGELNARDRARILINFLGQLREVEVSRNDLEQSNAPEQRQRVRSTRGGGRRIKAQSKGHN